MATVNSASAILLFSFVVNSYGLFVQILTILKLTATVFSYLAYDQYRLGEDTFHIEDTIDLDEFVMMNLLLVRSSKRLLLDHHITLTDWT
jgi:hypothetical protein